MHNTNTEQKILMEGDQKDFNIAGRDIINQQYKPEFFSPNLDDYEDSQFISPAETPKLVKMALEEGFLIIGGDGYDKSALGRYIALRVWNHFNGNAIEVKEWASSSNPQNLELHLQMKKKPTIFILPNISPHNVGYNLSTLYSTAHSRKHYVVISTDTSLGQWKLDANMQRLAWQPDSSKDLFNSQELVKLLLTKLD